MNEKLIEAVLQKKQNAFTLFYNDIVDHFFSYIKSNFSIPEEDIYDIISNTFIKIWNNLDTYNSSKGNFIPWCWTILRNNVKDYFKKRKDYTFTDLDSVNEDGDKNSFEDNLLSDEDIIETLESEYKYENIISAMKQLNFQEREIIYLRFTEEKSLDEISKIMGLTSSNTRVKLHRALQKLKKILGKL